MKAIKIDVDGVVTPMDDLGLKSLQSAVGGYIEAVESQSGKTTFWVNEEGKLMGLPVNLVGTELLYELHPAFRGYDILVGTVVVTGGADSHGNTLPITKEALERIKDLEIS